MNANLHSLKMFQLLLVWQLYMILLIFSIKWLFKEIISMEIYLQFISYLKELSSLQLASHITELYSKFKIYQEVMDKLVKWVFISQSELQQAIKLLLKIIQLLLN